MIIINGLAGQKPHELFVVFLLVMLIIFHPTLVIGAMRRADAVWRVL